MHSRLKRVYGEPLADMVDQRFGPKAVVFIAIVLMLLGGSNVIDALIRWAAMVRSAAVGGVR